MIARLIEGVAERLLQPGAWVQGAMAWDGRRPVPPRHPSAVAWDLMGAITVECAGDPEEIAAVLAFFKRTGWGREVTAVTFNDDPRRHHGEVIHFLKERAALARMENDHAERDPRPSR